MVRGYELDLKWLRIRKMANYRYSRENLDWNWRVSNFKMYIYDRISQIYFQLVEIQITCIWKWIYGYWLGFGLENRVSIPGKSKRFSLLQIVQTDFWAHPSSYKLGTPDLSWGKKRLVCEIKNSAQSNSKVKNKYIFTSTTSLRLNGVDRDNFVLYS